MRQLILSGIYRVAQKKEKYDWIEKRLRKMLFNMMLRGISNTYVGVELRKVLLKNWIFCYNLGGGAL